jgi:hypothetical protein
MHHACASPFCTAALCATAATCTDAGDDLDTSWNGTRSVLMPVAG